MILWLKDITKEDSHLVDKKAILLGGLLEAGFPITDGFVLTTALYFHFLHHNKLIQKINQLLATVNFEQPDSVLQVSNHMQKLIQNAAFSEEMVKEINTSYRKMSGLVQDAIVILSHDLHTTKKIKGDTNLLLAIKKTWASYFEPAHLLSRHEKKIDHFQHGVALVIQKMPKTEKSGVMLTFDPVTDNQKTIVIEAADGVEYYEIDKKDLSLINKMTTTIEPFLTDKEVTQLAQLAKSLEKHLYFAQEITWGFDHGNLMLLNTKPATISPAQKKDAPLSDKRQLLLTGMPASSGIARGQVRIIKKITESTKINQGDILVATTTNGLSRQSIRNANALITEENGRMSHAALMARALGIPAVVGAENATTILKSGHMIMVNGQKGEVYKDGYAATSQTATKLWLQLDNIDDTKSLAQEDIDGVGLLKAETFTKLTEQLARVCQAFHPRTVLYQLADYNDDEKKKTLLGFRGSYQLIHNTKNLQAELLAIKKIRDDMELQNLWLLIPFVRTVHEFTAIKHKMKDEGLHRTTNFELWMTLATPANVLLLEDFIKEGLDGIAIDVDMITMLLLGVDASASEVVNLLDPLNPSVLWALEKTIKTCHKHGIATSAFGRCLAMHPSLIEMLVKWGITNIVVDPKQVDATKELIATTERNLIRNKPYRI